MQGGRDAARRGRAQSHNLLGLDLAYLARHNELARTELERRRHNVESMGLACRAVHVDNLRVRCEARCTTVVPWVVSAPDAPVACLKDSAGLNLRRRRDFPV